MLVYNNDGWDRTICTSLIPSGTTLGLSVLVCKNLYAFDITCFEVSNDIKNKNI